MVVRWFIASTILMVIFNGVSAVPQHSTYSKPAVVV